MVWNYFTKESWAAKSGSLHFYLIWKVTFASFDFLFVTPDKFDERLYWQNVLASSNGGTLVFSAQWGVEEMVILENR